jgi:hypothetical protein
MGWIIFILILFVCFWFMLGSDIAVRAFVEGSFDMVKSKYPNISDEQALVLALKTRPQFKNLPNSLVASMIFPSKHIEMSPNEAKQFLESSSQLKIVKILTYMKQHSDITSIDQLADFVVYYEKAPDVYEPR